MADPLRQIGKQALPVRADSVRAWEQGQVPVGSAGRKRAQATGRSGTLGEVTEQAIASPAAKMGDKEYVADRAAILQQMILSGDPYKMAIAQDIYRKLDVPQRQEVDAAIQAAMPNPRSKQGLSPEARELIGALNGQGLSPERMRAIEAVRESEGFTPDQRAPDAPMSRRAPPDRLPAGADSRNTDWVRRAIRDQIIKDNPNLRGDALKAAVDAEVKRLPKQREVSTPLEERPTFRGPATRDFTVPGESSAPPALSREQLETARAAFPAYYERLRAEERRLLSRGSAPKRGSVTATSYEDIEAKVRKSFPEMTDQQVAQKADEIYQRQRLQQLPDAVEEAVLRKYPDLTQPEIDAEIQRRWEQAWERQNFGSDVSSDRSQWRLPNQEGWAISVLERAARGEPVPAADLRRASQAVQGKTEPVAGSPGRKGERGKSGADTSEESSFQQFFVNLRDTIGMDPSGRSASEFNSARSGGRPAPIDGNIEGIGGRIRSQEAEATILGEDDSPAFGSAADEFDPEELADTGPGFMRQPKVGRPKKSGGGGGIKAENMSVGAVDRLYRNVLRAAGVSEKGADALAPISHGFKKPKEFADFVIRVANSTGDTPMVPPSMEAAVSEQIQKAAAARWGADMGLKSLPTGKGSKAVGNIRERFERFQGEAASPAQASPATASPSPEAPESVGGFPVSMEEGGDDFADLFGVTPEQAFGGTPSTPKQTQVGQPEPEVVSSGGRSPVDEANAALDEANSALDEIGPVGPEFDAQQMRGRLDEVTGGPKPAAPQAQPPVVKPQRQGRKPTATALEKAIGTKEYKKYVKDLGRMSQYILGQPEGSQQLADAKAYYEEAAEVLKSLRSTPGSEKIAEAFEREILGPLNQAAAQRSRKPPQAQQPAAAANKPAPANDTIDPLESASKTEITPPATQRARAIWSGPKQDYPVTVVGSVEQGPDGRGYVRVEYEGQQSYVPVDQLRPESGGAASTPTPTPPPVPPASPAPAPVPGYTATRPQAPTMTKPPIVGQRPTSTTIVGSAPGPGGPQVPGPATVPTPPADDSFSAWFRGVLDAADPRDLPEYQAAREFIERGLRRAANESMTRAGAKGRSVDAARTMEELRTRRFPRPGEDFEELPLPGGAGRSANPQTAAKDADTAAKNVDAAEAPRDAESDKATAVAAQSAQEANAQAAAKQVETAANAETKPQPQKAGDSAKPGMLAREWDQLKKYEGWYPAKKAFDVARWGLGRSIKTGIPLGIAAVVADNYKDKWSPYIPEELRDDVVGGVGGAANLARAAGSGLRDLLLGSGGDQPGGVSGEGVSAQPVGLEGPGVGPGMAAADGPIPGPGPINTVPAVDEMGYPVEDGSVDRIRRIISTTRPSSQVPTGTMRRATTYYE